MLIEVISCAAITTATQRAANFTYILYFLFDVSITNAFILWKHFSSVTGMTLEEFRLWLAQQLIGDYCSRQRAGHGGGAIHPLPL